MFLLNAQRRLDVLIIHSFGNFYSASSSLLLFRGAPYTAPVDTVSEFHDYAPQATASEGLAQGPYLAASAGFEPTTFRTKGYESTNDPPSPMCVIHRGIALCVRIVYA